MSTNILSVDAYEILRSEKNSSILFDVRTEPEWQENIPDIENIRCLSWRNHYQMTANPLFAETILNIIKDVHLNLFFICRAGVRSAQAMEFTKQLLAQRGDSIKRNYYNIIDGFCSTKSSGWAGNILPVRQYCAS